MAEYNNGMWVCQCQYRKECNRDCGMYRKLSGKLSNADRIRAMSDKELADWYFDKFFPCVPYCSVFDECPEHDDCKICLLEWLKQEAK